MTDRLPLPSDTLAIAVLNSSIPSRYLPTMTVFEIFQQLFVEDWQISSNFEGYYNTCAPSACIYTYNKRMDVLFIVSTVISITGGLLIILRLFIPSVAEVSRSQMPNAEHIGMLATRIYSILFGITILFIIIFTGLSEVIISKVVCSSTVISSEFTTLFTCNCAVSSTCQQPLRIGPSDLILPGLVIGCSPMEGLHYYTQIDGSPPVNFTPPKTPPIVIASLNTSLSTRFLPSTQIGELIHEMFLEQLTNVISYEKYYATCAPSVCRYEYVERSNILYIVTTLLGLYGAVSVGLRLLIWNSLRIYHKIKNYFHYHNAAIQPQTSIITH
ncbi:unnamed protein product [Rotaria sp. Silwood1]|nr:unnamed protein product [Rotaria sp. Silwood1]CAF4866617.1 unnamed protein product [Rotaria sp. Silwood1]